MTIKNVLRVFPRRTKATPDDDLAVTCPPNRELLGTGGFDRVDVSVTYTYDKPKAEELAEAWTKAGFSVSIGGPAYGDRMAPTFEPGRYLKPGYVITSRGCPNNCWFCSVAAAARGKIIELPIVDGYNILDDNLCATSEQHFRAVMLMLQRQKQRPIFTGGIEAARLQLLQARMIHDLHPARVYCAYDTPDDWEPLLKARKLFREAGFSDKTHVLACYVLIGYDGDTFEAAEKRLTDTVKAGYFPFAMLYRDEQGQVRQEWRRFQREWANPYIVGCKVKEIREGLRFSDWMR